MVRTLLKTSDNKQQIKFIIMCSSNNWTLRSKLVTSRFMARKVNKSYEFIEVIASSKKYIRKS